MQRGNRGDILILDENENYYHPYYIMLKRKAIRNNCISIMLLDLVSATCKICDFGLSEQNRDLIDTLRISLSSKASKAVGTVVYKAPELFYNTLTSTPVIAFSCLYYDF